MSMSLTPEVIHALVSGEHGDPFAVLGPHDSTDANLTVRAFLPGAGGVAVVTDSAASGVHPPANTASRRNRRRSWSDNRS